jgi:hypothetical protein
MQICDIFRAKIIDVQLKNVSIEITGNESKIDKFLMLMEPFGITDLTRTGKVALARKQVTSFFFSTEIFQPKNQNHARKNLHRQRRRASNLSKTKPAPCSASARRATRTRST